MGDGEAGPGGRGPGRDTIKSDGPTVQRGHAA